jgi:hypothetical protein
MFRYLGLLLTAALIGCATMTGAVSLPSGDTKNWITYRVEVGSQVVQFAIPPGVNTNFLDPPVPQRIDLQQPGLFDQTGSGPRILSRHWDYQRSPTALIDGTLHAAIWVKQNEKILNSLGALELAVRESQELSRAMDVMRGGYIGPPNPPIKFDAAKVGNHRGLYVHYKSSLPDYAVAIDDHHYLVIYVDSTGVTSPGWREDARAAAEAILNSIRIEPKT